MWRPAQQRLRKSPRNRAGRHITDCATEGRICEPSTAALGVEQWIASLRAIRANRSASPANVVEKAILGICGLTSIESLAKLNRHSYFSKTCPATSALDSTRLPQTLKAWATKLRRGSLLREEIGASHKRERLFILAVGDARGHVQRREHIKGRGAEERVASGGASAPVDRPAHDDSHMLAVAHGGGSWPAIGDASGQGWRPAANRQASVPQDARPRTGQSDGDFGAASSTLANDQSERRGEGRPESEGREGESVLADAGGCDVGGTFGRRRMCRTEDGRCPRNKWRPE